MQKTTRAVLAASLVLVFAVAFVKAGQALDLTQRVHMSSFSMKLPQQRQWNVISMEPPFVFRCDASATRSYVAEFGANAAEYSEYFQMLSQIPAKDLPDTYSELFESVLVAFRSEAAKENSGVSVFIPFAPVQWRNSPTRKGTVRIEKEKPIPTGNSKHVR